MKVTYSLCIETFEDSDGDENIIIKQIFRKFVLKIKRTRTRPSNGGLLILAVLNKDHTGCIIKAYKCLNLTALRCCLS
jgi:hypothetical protein